MEISVRSRQLFLLEDDPYAMGIIPHLEQYGKGFEVTHVAELDSAIYCFDHDPGINYFGKFIFDISVPKCTYIRNDKTIVYGNTLNYAGLDFILDQYQNNDLFCQCVREGRMVILTAHDNACRQALNKSTGKAAKNVLQQIPIITKVQDDMLFQVRRFLSGTLPIGAHGGA